MKIAVVTPGRSHLLNMSKELVKAGHEVVFYTMVSKSRCEKFGLKRENVISFFSICAPLMLLYRKIKLPFDWNRWIYYFVVRIVDWLSSIFLKRCDILISISGCGMKSAKKAKTKYKALFFVDRGCKHILAQDHILKNTPGAKLVFQPDIANELFQYDYADQIILPSNHSKESFEEYGVPENKLFVNPYGVNNSIFGPTASTSPNYDVIMVGIWTYRKGVDLLTKACKKANLTLLHVGPIGDADFPNDSQFTHINPVNETELPQYYSQAKILCLPSREDGFGLVLFQALACGLPVVYSHNTGGPDLRELVECKQYLIEFNTYTSESLAEALLAGIKQSSCLNNPRSFLTKNDLNNISWDAYGNRYNQFLTHYPK